MSGNAISASAMYTGGGLSSSIIYPTTSPMSSGGPSGSFNMYGSLILNGSPEDLMSVRGENNRIIFTVKNSGEFVTGPGFTDNESVTEFTKLVYKNLTNFGKSFSETLAEKERKIKELEKELADLKSNKSAK